MYGKRKLPDEIIRQRRLIPQGRLERRQLFAAIHRQSRIIAAILEIHFPIDIEIVRWRFFCVLPETLFRNINAIFFLRQRIFEKRIL